MESTSKPKNLLIDSGDSNHMMESIDSFLSLDADKRIFIHMGDDSQIISKGKVTINLEHGSFFDVLYVPSLTSNILSVYQMNHTGVPKRFTFIINDVEITEIAFKKLFATGIQNQIKEVIYVFFQNFLNVC